MKQNTPPTGLIGVIVGIIVGLKLGWYGLPFYLTFLVISDGEIRTISEMLNKMGESSKFNTSNEIGFQLGFLPWGILYVVFLAVGIKLLISIF